MNFRHFYNTYFSWNLFLVISINLFFAFTFYLDAPNYEFTLINSLLAFLLFGFYSISSSYRNKFSFITSSLFLLAPIFISILSNCFNKNCPVSQSVIIYLITIIPTLVLAYSLAKLSLFISSSIGKKVNSYKFIPYGTFVILFLFIALESLLEFYYYPQVYLFNPIIGYFSGTIYDDKIEVNSVFILYRTIVFVFSILLLIILRSRKRRIFLFGMLVGYLIFAFNKPNFDFASDYNRIVSNLGNVIETDHFQIIIPLELDSNRLKNIILEHEYFFSKHEAKFKLSKNNSLIKSFVFRNNNEKRVLFGAGNADVAKPWLRQIYTEFEGLEQTLEHELIHIFAANYGSTLLKISHNLNPYLLEGLPVGLVEEINKRDIDYFAKMLRQNNIDFSVNNFNSLFNFFSVNSFISYVYAGSFIKFLVENYAFESVSDLYNSGEIERNFGKNLNQLFIEFYRHLDSLKYDFRQNEFSFYFGRAPIYSRICPRELSVKKEKAEKLFAEKKYGASLELYSEIFDLNNDPGALNGMFQNLSELGKYDKAIELIEKNILSFQNSNYYLFMKLKLADYYFLDEFQNNPINKDVQNLENEATNFRKTTINQKVFDLYNEIGNESPNFNYYFSSFIRKKLLNYPKDLNLYLQSGIDSVTINQFSFSSSEDSSLQIIKSYLQLVMDKDFQKFHLQDLYQFTNLPYFEEFFINLSTQLIREKKYQTAKEVLELANHNINKEEFLFKINENLKKIDWLTNFGHKIKFIENTSH